MRRNTTKDTNTRHSTLYVCDGCSRRVRTFVPYTDEPIAPRCWTRRGDKYFCDAAGCKKDSYAHSVAERLDKLEREMRVNLRECRDARGVDAGENPDAACDVVGASPSDEEPGQ